MKKPIYVVVILLLIIVTACTETGKIKPLNSPLIMNINPKNINNKVKLSSIFSGIKIITLKTDNKEGLVGKINKILQGNNGKCLIIGDGNSLKIFNSDGNFKFELENGEGPGKFNHIGAFTTGYNDTTFSFIDYYKQKLYVYSFNDKMLNSAYLKLNVENFSAINNNVYALYSSGSGEKYKLNYFDLKTNKIVDRYFHFSKEYSRFLNIMANNFFKWNDSTYFINVPFDTVYFLNSNLSKPAPAIVANFGKYEFKKKYYNMPFQNIMELIQFTQKNNLAFDIDRFFPVENSLFFSYSYAGRFYPAVYNIRSKMVKNLFKFTDDVAVKGHTVKLFNYFYPIGNVMEGLVFAVDPLQLKEQVDSIVKPMDNKALHKFKKDNMILYNTYTKITPKTNTLLVIYEAKKN